MAVISQLKTRSKNLLNKANSEEDYFINSSGVKSYAPGYGLAVTEKIYVKPSTTYVYTGMGNVSGTTVTRTGFQYDVNDNPIKTLSPSGGGRVLFTTEPNCHYVYLQYIKTEEKPMLEENNIATEYEPYYLDITKYNNELIRNINFNGVNYNFAKKSNSIDKVCAHAVQEPIIDLKISGNSVQGGLPIEYRQVEYIESTGTQYIDTEIMPNQNTGFDVEFLTKNKFNMTSGEFGSIFGAREGSSVNELQLSSYSRDEDKGLIRFGDRGRNAGLIENTKMQCSLKNKIYTNYNDVTINFTNDFATPCSLTVFALNNNGTITQHGSVQIFSLKLYNLDTLIRDFVPCYRKSDGVIGLYDLVEQKFYTNQGTGNFIKGAEIINSETLTVVSPNPEYPQEVESVGDKTSNIFSSYGVSTGGLNNPSADRRLSNTVGTTINSIDFTGEIIATQSQYPNITNPNDYNNGYFNVGVNGLETGKKYTLICNFEIFENPLAYTNQAILINGAYSIFGTVLDNRVKYIFEWKKPAGYENREFIEFRLAGRNMKFTNFMILEGEVSDFQDYVKTGYKVPVNISGINLFDYSTILDAGKIEIMDKKTGEFKWKSTEGIPATYMKTKPNTRYRVTFKAKTMVEQTAIVAVYYKDGTVKGIETKSSPDGFTVADGLTLAGKSVDYVKFGGSGGLSIGSIFKGLMIVEEGTELDGYEPHLDETTNIYINEPLRKIGEYADYIDYKNKKVVRKIVEKVFDGTENLRNITTLPYPYTFLDIGELGLVTPDVCLCTHLQHQSDFSYLKEGNNKFRVLNSTTNNKSRIVFRFYLNNSVVSDVDEVKALLSEYYNTGKPMIVYYAHADGLEIEETIDIPEISTSKGTNIFDTKTNIKPSDIEINYWKQI